MHAYQKRQWHSTFPWAEYNPTCHRPPSIYFYHMPLTTLFCHRPPTYISYIGHLKHLLMGHIQPIGHLNTTPHRSPTPLPSHRAPMYLRPYIPSHRSPSYNPTLPSLPTPLPSHRSPTYNPTYLHLGHLHPYPPIGHLLTTPHTFP